MCRHPQVYERGGGGRRGYLSCNGAALDLCVGNVAIEGGVDGLVLLGGAEEGERAELRANAFALSTNVVFILKRADLPFQLSNSFFFPFIFPLPTLLCHRHSLNPTRDSM